MPELSPFVSNLLVAFTAYLVGVASPGPSNMAIMATAMARGRPQALALATGVVSGSLFWGFAAALGLSALMQAYSWSLVVLKVIGGAYMLWLAFKAAREAWSPSDARAAAVPQAGRFRDAYVRGLAMHLTNPKAIFVWLSIVALALPRDAARGDAFIAVAGCAVLGMIVFFGYALAFSTEVARRVYRRIQRAFNATLAAVFAYAGLRMLLARGSA